MTDPTETGTQAPATTGARLAAARIALGLSVAEAAAQMRLAPRQVEALEADRYADLPGPVFVRGFLRNYARVLKLDPQPLLAAIEPAASDVAPLRGHLAADEIPFPTRRRARWIPYAIVLAVLVFGAAAIEYWFARRAETLAEPSAPSAAAPAPAPASSMVALSPNPVVVQEGAAAAATSVAPVTEPSGAGERGAVQVRLRFAGESWVEVRDRAGTVLHNRSHRGGEEVRLDAPRGATFVIGNAGVVRMTYNDAPFDLAPHSNVGVARFNLE
jgi:cytoskeleton protein RodZ